MATALYSPVRVLAPAPVLAFGFNGIDEIPEGLENIGLDSTAHGICEECAEELYGKDLRNNAKGKE